MRTVFTPAGYKLIGNIGIENSNAWKRKGSIIRLIRWNLNGVNWVNRGEDLWKAFLEDVKEIDKCNQMRTFGMILCYFVCEKSYIL